MTSKISKYPYVAATQNTTKSMIKQAFTWHKSGVKRRFKHMNEEVMQK